MRFNPFRSLEENQRITLPGFLVSFTLNCLLIVVDLIWIFPNSIRHHAIAWIGIIGISLILITYLWILPGLRRHPDWIWWLLIINFLGLVVMMVLEPPEMQNLSLLHVGILLFIIASVSGRKHTYTFLLCIIVSRWLFLQTTGQVVADAIPLISLTALLYSILALEMIFAFRQLNQRQINRLQKINQVAKSVSSSLEIHQVIALLSSAIQNALDADTYFVGLINGKSLRLELLYDEGEFYPPTDLDLDENLGSSLSAWVVINKKPILVGDVLHEAKDYGIAPATIGGDKMSLSWMGCPLESSGQVFGMVAVASYQKNVFQPGDLEYLLSISQHAAMAIDNAFHHAEVEHQSRIDSLTEVLNHNVFLKELQTAAEEALVSQRPISLIMLDIDHFKKYNDQYGHLVGDKVLKQLVQSIAKNIKKQDLVGRWGGEEFAIALCNATGEQAYYVAQRIRATLADMQLIDRNGVPIPAPTASQGIAILPNETGDIFTLIDIADQRLYVAKSKGRDQIEPRNGKWAPKKA